MGLRTKIIKHSINERCRDHVIKSQKKSKVRL
jgi:hypothetical protein